jgi:hypothetical protein
VRLQSPTPSKCFKSIYLDGKDIHGKIGKYYVATGVPGPELSAFLQKRAQKEKEDRSSSKTKELKDNEWRELSRPVYDELPVSMVFVVVADRIVAPQLPCSLAIRSRCTSSTLLLLSLPYLTFYYLV